MNMRLLTSLIAAAALSGCATYDYAGGSGAGGYYYGQPSTKYYGPYGGAYGYPSYGYGGYHYGYSYYDPYGYYGGYYPYYPHWPRPPRPPHTDKPDPPDRAPAWRNPQDGRYRESGRVKIPPHNRSVVPASPGQPQVRNPGVRQRVNDGEPQRQMSQPSAPQYVERPRPVERVERAAPAPRSENRDRVRSQEP